MAQIEIPRYKHDCDVCVFVGKHNEYDLYFCKSEPTVVARYGLGADYMSGLDFVKEGNTLGEAKRRAIEKGLFSEAEFISLTT